MSQRTASAVYSIQGALQACIIDLDELCVGGLFHVGGKHNVGDAGKERPQEGLASEKIRAVVSPFGL
ncbi:hypothetical protein AALI21_11040 [Corynebacteriaceae bacterium 6-324]